MIKKVKSSFKKSMAIFLSFVFIASSSACSKEDTKVSTDADGKKVVTFACFNLNNTDEGILDIAAKKFNESNADTVLVIKDYAKSGFSADKYLNVLNTELMSGKGPDIISICDLPAIKYMKKNILTDLDPILSADKEFDASKYFMNIINASRYKGHLYCMPINFNIQALVGSRTTLDSEKISIDDKNWTLGDFVAIAEKVTQDRNGDGVPERVALPIIEMKAVAQLFIATENYIDYDNMKANFDSPQFVALLDLLRVLYDNKLTHKKIKITDNIPYKDSLAIVFSGGEIDGYRGMLSMKYRLGGGDRSFFRLPSSSQERATGFDSRQMLAINNASRNKPFAWEFIKILLSDQMQMLYAGAESKSGFPIHKEAFQKQLINVQKLDWRLNNSGGWIPVIFNADEIKFVQDYVSEINSYHFRDARLEKVVIDEISALFAKGITFKKKDAENVAKAIQKRAKLYLEE